MNKLTLAAVELVTKHGVRHKDIIKEIRKALVEASENYPKTRVAYCGSFGGYGFSDQFEAFLGPDSDIFDGDEDEDRVLIVPKLKEFGKLMSEKYPQIYETIRRYEYHSFGVLSSFLAFRRFNESIDKILESVEAIKDSDLRWAKVKQIPKEEIADFEQFRKTSGIDKLRQEVDVPRGSFATGAEKLDVSDVKLWFMQDRYSAVSIKYLLENAGKFPAPRDDNFDCYEQMGLLFASGRYCKLRIEEVPKFVDWRIHEYDGKESIILK